MNSQPAMECATGTAANASRRRSIALDLCVLLALAVQLCRSADGLPLLPPTVVVLSHLPLLALIIRQVITAQQGHKTVKFSTCELPHAGIMIVAGIACILVSAIHYDVVVGCLAFALFAFGCRLVTRINQLLVECDRYIDAPMPLLRRLAAIWLTVALFVSGILVLPCATNPGVPDYKYDAFGHVSAGIQTAMSVACLQGGTALDMQGDLQPFGQLILLALLQFSGALFSILALSLIRPFLARPLTIRRMLLIAMSLQIVGAAVLFTAWQSNDAPTNLSRVWWSLAHSTSALWNAGITLSPAGLSDYLDDPSVYLTITALAVVGSLGIPILSALLQPAANDKEMATLPLRGHLPTIEALAAFQMLALTTVCLVLLEDPSSRFFEQRPALPFEVSRSTEPLCEMERTDRWQAAVYTSATLRSAGMSSIPVSQGTLGWPSLGLLATNVWVGAGLGGTGGGLRITFVIVLVARVLGRNKNRKTSKLPPMRRLFAVGFIWISFQIASTVAMWCIVDAPLYEIVFDTMAAATSSGYTTGLSPYLPPMAKLLLAMTLLIGRWLPLLLWAWLLEGLFATRPLKDAS